MTETSPSETRAGWTRFFLPSVTDLIFLALLISLSSGAISQRLLGDAGIGWHIRNGEQILITHSVTRTDSFSSTMNGKTWYAWEWLYDLLIASIHHDAGLNGVVFFSAFIIALTFALTFRLTLTRGANLGTAILFLLLALCASTIHFLARPHLLGWLLAVIWIYLLDSSDINPGRNRRLFWLPVLMLLWVNLHGGFITGFMLLGIYIVSSAGYWLFSKDQVQRAASGRRLRFLGAAAMLCAIASLINPYGYKLHVHVYEYLSNRFLMDHIDEFLSPNFHGIAEQCFAFLVLLTLLTLALARTKPRPVELLVIIFAVASGFYASRSLPVSSLLLTLMVAPLWREQSESDAASSRVRAFLKSFNLRMGGMERRLDGHLWAVAAVFAGIWVCAHSGNLGTRRIMNAHFDATRFPIQAVDQLVVERVQGPIFSPDYWGGYLIYRLSPVPVVVDDRHDLYGESFLKDYLKVTKVEPGWDKVLDSYNTEWVLVPAEAPLSNMLMGNKQWMVMYQNHTAILFRRFNYAKNL